MAESEVSVTLVYPQILPWKLPGFTQLIRFLGNQNPSWSVTMKVPSAFRQTPLGARKPVAMISVVFPSAETRNTVPCWGTVAFRP